MTDGFIFYQSFYEALQDLSPEDRLAAYDAICEYGITGQIGELSGTVRAIFLLVKPQIDANEKRRENGKKGGRPKANNNQTETKQKPNDNQNETKNEANTNLKKNGKVKEKAKDIIPPTPLTESEMSDRLKVKVEEWVQYKKERRESYKPTGFKHLVTEVENMERKYGTNSVIEAIDTAMASGWKGMNLDRIRGEPNKFAGSYSFQRDPYDYAALVEN